MRKRILSAALAGLRSAGRATGLVVNRYGEDILIAAGLAVIIWATFRLGTTAGLYALGVSLLGVGIVLARQPPRGR